MMQDKKIVFLASDCESSQWVYNALIKDIQFAAVIIEQPVSKKKLVKGRIKKIGIGKVTGQILFSALIVPWLKKKAISRKQELLALYQLDNSAISHNNLLDVNSVNDDACKKLLEQVQPDIIIVNGTRIISKKILQCCQAVFINMHVGITPAYRGSHGGYWALYNHDPKNFGTTIHLVDTGVDTGAVLKQVFMEPGTDDNFTTYPILQVAIGIQALKQVLQEAIKGNYNTGVHAGKGKMYHQPTIWQYLLHGTK